MVEYTEEEKELLRAQLREGARLAQEVAIKRGAKLHPRITEISESENAMKFEIGQKLWLASWESTEDFVTCPDCGGTGRLRVTFHDETTVSIECAGCSVGYEPPKGYVRVYNRHARALPVTITGVEVRDGKTEWRTDRHYCPDEGDLYDNENDCLAGALLKAQKADQEEREKVGAKEKPTRTWAWNAHYHRKEIKRCLESMEHHERKLAAANLKAREDKSLALSSNQSNCK